MGYTTLHWAAKLGRTDMIDFVWEHNRDVDVEHRLDYLHFKTTGGLTPLHVACLGEKEGAIKRLLELDAHTYEMDWNSNRPLDLVRGKIDYELIYQLERRKSESERYSK